jgi:hypothetical protein
MVPEARKSSPEPGPTKVLTSGLADTGDAGVSKGGSAKIAKASETASGSGNATSVGDAAGNLRAAEGWSQVHPIALAPSPAAAIAVDGTAGRMGFDGPGMPVLAESKVSAAPAEAGYPEGRTGAKEVGATGAENEPDGSAGRSGFPEMGMPAAAESRVSAAPSPTEHLKGGTGVEEAGATDAESVPGGSAGGSGFGAFGMPAAAESKVSVVQAPVGHVKSGADAKEAGATRAENELESSAAGVGDAAGNLRAAEGRSLVQPIAVVPLPAAAIAANGRAGRSGFPGLGIPEAAQSKIGAAPAPVGHVMSEAGAKEAGATRAENGLESSADDDLGGAAPKTQAVSEMVHAIEGRSAGDGGSTRTAGEAHTANSGAHAGSARAENGSAQDEAAARPLQPDTSTTRVPANLAMPAEGLGARVQVASGAAKRLAGATEGQAGTTVAGVAGNTAASVNAQVPISMGNGTGRAPEVGQPGTATATARDPFAAIDEESVTPAPTWIQTGAHHAEAGYLDPALGWVGVRADAAGATMHAAIVPGSAEAAAALSNHLSALPAYLSEHHGQTASVTIASPEHGFGAAGQGQAGAGAGQDRAPGEPAGEQMNRTQAAAGSDGPKAPSAPQMEPAAMAHASGTGELISVIA